MQISTCCNLHCVWCWYNSNLITATWTIATGGNVLKNTIQSVIVFRLCIVVLVCACLWLHSMHMVIQYNIVKVWSRELLYCWYCISIDSKHRSYSRSYSVFVPPQPRQNILACSRDIKWSGGFLASRSIWDTQFSITSLKNVGNTLMFRPWCTSLLHGKDVFKCPEEDWCITVETSVCVFLHFQAGNQELCIPVGISIGDKRVTDTVRLKSTYCTIKPCTLLYDVIEAHCYVVNIRQTDCEQIRSRIINNWCRMFRPLWSWVLWPSNSCICGGYQDQISTLWNYPNLGLYLVHNHISPNWYIYQLALRWKCCMSKINYNILQLLHTMYKHMHACATVHREQVNLETCWSLSLQTSQESV